MTTPAKKPFKLIYFLLLLPILTCLSFFAAFHFLVQKHHDNISKMYEFAGVKYQELEHKLDYQFDNPIKAFVHSQIMPKGSTVNAMIFNKSYLSQAGLTQECRDIEYLKILKTDIDQDVYKDSPLCCLPNIIGGMLPLVYDKQDDRILVMCGLADGGHVIGLEADKFNKLLNMNNLDEPFDIRDEN